MNLLYDGRPATKDIDCIFSKDNFKIFENILNDVGKSFDLERSYEGNVCKIRTFK